MKIKQKHISYDEMLKIPRAKHKKPLKPWGILGALIRVLSIGELRKTRFTFEKESVERLPEGPCLFLMNHSSFLDLKIAYRLLYPKKRFCVVCTTDALVGKGLLMRLLGCIPTQKFVTDINLVFDILHAIRENRTSVLLFPEAGYSFDGTATVLPKKFGQLLQKADVPVVMIRTDGAFLYDPLYNGLQKRRVKTSAVVNLLLTQEEVREKSVEELDAIVREAFTFDAFATQKEKGVRVTETFRADGLHRILYACPACGVQGQTRGENVTLTCRACGKRYTLTELGEMQAEDGVTEYRHIPDWYAWERAEVRKELEAGVYRVEEAVDIAVLCDNRALYFIGEGTLTHTCEGFTLNGCDGKLNYTQKPRASYSLNADYFWYEIGDVVSVGDRRRLYYCFPKDKSKNIVTKLRLGAEELYKIEIQK